MSNHPLGGSHNAASFGSPIVTETASDMRIAPVVPAKVLLVDDEPDILPEYQELLELHGLCALTEADPETALEKVLECPDIAVVVTDMRMAKLNGAELIEAVRARLSKGRKVEFIVLTGDSTYCATIIDPDIPVFLKPVDFDALVGAVKVALAGAQ